MNPVMRACASQLKLILLSAVLQNRRATGITFFLLSILVAPTWTSAYQPLCGSPAVVLV